MPSVQHVTAQHIVPRLSGQYEEDKGHMQPQYGVHRATHDVLRQTVVRVESDQTCSKNLGSEWVSKGAAT